MKSVNVAVNSDNRKDTTVINIRHREKPICIPQFENCADIIEDDIDEFVELEEAKINSRERKTSDQVIEMKKDLISLFIQHGSDIEAKDSKGQNALMFASKLEGFEKILELLLISGADPNKCNKEGKSALHFAVSENHLKNVMTLLNNAADVNKKCYHGNTCLHLSAKNQNVEIFKVLLKHGADIEAKNSKGQTVLMFSSESAENGGVAANVKTENVFQLIYEGQFTLIQKLIFAGLSPSGMSYPMADDTVIRHIFCKDMG
ncbi:hypothetical protein Btru_043471 [Bulinus truncatus]|nr:hypothetical protein Btru_043471 [Bulinus truncatus]